MAKVLTKRKLTFLTLEKKLEIIEKIEKGHSGKSLSLEYGVGTSTISDIKKQKESIRKLYMKHIPSNIKQCDSTEDQHQDPMEEDRSNQEGILSLEEFSNEIHEDGILSQDEFSNDIHEEAGILSQEEFLYDTQEGFHSKLREIRAESNAEPSISSSPYQDVEIPWMILKEGSQMQKDLLIESPGYSYTIKKLKGNSVYWRCTMRNNHVHCEATVIQKGSEFQKNHITHIHDSKPGLATIYQVRKKVRQAAASEEVQSVRDLVDKVLQEVSKETLAAMPSACTLTRLLSKMRRRVNHNESRNEVSQHITSVNSEQNIPESNHYDGTWQEGPIHDGDEKHKEFTNGKKSANDDEFVNEDEPANDSVEMNDNDANIGPLNANFSNHDVISEEVFQKSKKLKSESPNAIRSESKDDNVTWTVLKEGSQGNKDLLIESTGYSYVLKRVRKNDAVCWRCSKRNGKITCGASVIQKGDKFERSSVSHSHSAIPGLTIASIVKKKIRLAAKRENPKRAGEIVNKILQNFDYSEVSSNLLEPDNLTQRVNRIRKRMKLSKTKGTDSEDITRFNSEQNIPGSNHYDGTWQEGPIHDEDEQYKEFTNGKKPAHDDEPINDDESINDDEPANNSVEIDDSDTNNGLLNKNLGTHEVITEEVFQKPKKLESESLDAIPPESRDDYVTWTVLKEGSQGNKDLLIESTGYSYVLKRVRKNDVVYWRCSKRNGKITCGASVIQKGDEFERNSVGHNHSAIPGLAIASIVKKKIRLAAKKDNSKRPGEIVNEILQNFNHSEVSSNLLEPDNLTQCINRIRKRMKLSKTKATDFEHTTNYEKQDIDGNIGPLNSNLETHQLVSEFSKNGKRLISSSVGASTSELREENPTWTILKEGSQRNKDLLIESPGYSYSIKKCKKDIIVWRCCMRSGQINCKATVMQKGNEFERSSFCHTHGSIRGIAVAREVRRKVRLAAKKESPQKAGELVKEVLEDYGHCKISPEVLQASRLTQCVNKIRRRMKPSKTKFKNSEDTLDGQESTKELEGVTWAIMKEGSQRQKDLLLESRGFKFVIKKRVGDLAYWRCCMRSDRVKCRATVIQKGDDDFRRGSAKHSHSATDGLDTLHKIKKKVREVAKVEMYQSAESIVNEILKEVNQGEVTSDMPKIDNLARCVNKMRERLRPRDPNYKTRKGRQSLGKSNKQKGQKSPIMSHQSENQPELVHTHNCQSPGRNHVEFGKTHLPSDPSMQYKVHQPYENIQNPTIWHSSQGFQVAYNPFRTIEEENPCTSLLTHPHTIYWDLDRNDDSFKDHSATAPPVGTLH